MEVFFIICSIVTIAGAVLVVTQRVAIYSLLGLLVSFFGTAGIFYTLDAGFLAVSQVLVYAGALAVLFLFVLMFASDAPPDVGPLITVQSRKVFDPAQVPKGGEGRPRPRFVLPSPLAALVSVCTLVVLYVAIYKLPAAYKQFGALPATVEVARTTQPASGPPVTDSVQFGSTQALSHTIFDKFPLAFEVVSLLIFAAILGAVLLTRSQVKNGRVEHEAAPEGGDHA